MIPEAVRRRLGLRAGDALSVAVKGDRITLVPARARRSKPKIVDDEVTGLPVLTAGDDAPTLTSAQVRTLLSDFP